MGIQHVQSHIDINILLNKLDIKFLNIKSLFYKQILEYWFNFIDIEPDKTSIFEESLWFNKYVTVNRRPLYQEFKNYKNFIQARLAKIKHLIKNVDNKILKREELEEVYNVPISQLSYDSLVSSIPLKWKLIIKNSISIIQNVDHCYVTKLGKSILKTNNKEINSKLT